jgi:hypothetical protein
MVFTTKKRPIKFFFSLFLFQLQIVLVKLFKNFQYFITVYLKSEYFWLTLDFSLLLTWFCLPEYFWLSLDFSPFPSIYWFHFVDYLNKYLILTVLYLAAKRYINHNVTKKSNAQFIYKFDGFHN